MVTKKQIESKIRHYNQEIERVIKKEINSRSCILYHEYNQYDNMIIDFFEFPKIDRQVNYIVKNETRFRHDLISLRNSYINDMNYINYALIKLNEKVNYKKSL